MSRLLRQTLHNIFPTRYLSSVTEVSHNEKAFRKVNIVTAGTYMYIFLPYINSSILNIELYVGMSVGVSSYILRTIFFTAGHVNRLLKQGLFDPIVKFPDLPNFCKSKSILESDHKNPFGRV